MVDLYGAGNPFLPKKRRKLGEGYQPDEQEPPVEYTPEEETNLLSSIGHGALSGLNYVGGMLDKFTGSRALRGLLGGKPKELLSVIPGSDTFGLTNPNDTVYGKDLLKWNDSNSIADDIAGFAVDVALDPTWMVGGPVISGAGKAAKAAGMMGKAGKAAQVMKTLGKGKRQFELSGTLRNLLEHGTRKQTLDAADTAAHYVDSAVTRFKPGDPSKSVVTLLDQFDPTKTRTEFDALERVAKAQGKDVWDMLDDPLMESLASIKVPFTDIHLAKIGKGDKALKTAGVLDATGKLISKPLEGFGYKPNEKAVADFRQRMRDEAPTHITDDVLDSQLRMHKAYVEGVLGKDFGEYLRTEKMKIGDQTVPSAGNTLWQGDTPTWESKFIKAVEQNRNKRFTKQELQAMAKKAGVKDEEVEWAKLDDLFKNDATAMDKASVMAHLKSTIDPDFLLQEVDDAMRGGEVTDGGIPGTRRTFAIQSKNLPDNPNVGHLGGNVKTPIGYVRVQDWDLGSGRKGLVVENIQSDLHQKGRKYGYTDQKDFKRLAGHKEEVAEAIDRYRLSEDALWDNLKGSLGEEDATRFLNATIMIERGMLEHPEYFRGATASDEVLQRHVDYLADRYRTQTTGLRHPVPTLYKTVLKEAQNNPKLAGLIEDFYQKRADLAQLNDSVDGRALQAFQDGELIPNLPFKNNRWTEKLLQQVAKVAQDGGYDEILLTTGKEQVFRWGVGELAPFYDKTVRDSAKRAIGHRGEAKSVPSGIEWERGAAPGNLNGFGRDRRFRINRNDSDGTVTLYGQRGDNGGPVDRPIKVVRHDGTEDGVGRAVEELKVESAKHVSPVDFYAIPVADIKKRPYSLFQNGDQATSRAWKSKAREAVQSKVKQKVTEDQLISILKGAGVKDEEIRQSNIQGLFHNNDKTIDRDNILKWFDVEELDDRVETRVLTRGNSDPAKRTVWGPAFETNQRVNPHGIKTRVEYAGSSPRSYKELLFIDRNSDYKEPHWRQVPESDGAFAHIRGEDVNVDGKKYFGVHEVQSKLVEDSRFKATVADYKETFDDIGDVVDWANESGRATDDIKKTLGDLGALTERVAEGTMIAPDDMQALAKQFDESHVKIAEEQRNRRTAIRRRQSAMDDLDDRINQLVSGDPQRHVLLDEINKLQDKNYVDGTLLDDLNRAERTLRNSKEDLRRAADKAAKAEELKRYAFTSGDQWMQTSARGLLKHLVDNGYEGLLFPAGNDVPTVQTSGRADTLTKLYDEIYPKVMEKEVRKYGGKMVPNESGKVAIEWKNVANDAPSPNATSIEDVIDEFKYLVGYQNNNLRSLGASSASMIDADMYIKTIKKMQEMVDNGQIGDWNEGMDALSRAEVENYNRVQEYATLNIDGDHGLPEVIDRLQAAVSRRDEVLQPLKQKSFTAPNGTQYHAYEVIPGSASSEWEIYDATNARTIDNVWIPGGASEDQIHELLSRTLERHVDKRGPLGRASRLDFTNEIKKGFAGPQAMWQGGQQAPKGATTFLPSGETILQTFASADASTHVHEFLHSITKTLPQKMVDKFNDFLGKPAGTKAMSWSVADHERLAEGFEKFWLKGYKPSGELAPVWRNIQGYMASVYNTVTKQAGLADVSPAVDELYRSLIHGRPANLRGYTLPSMGRGTQLTAKAMDKAGELARYNKATMLGARRFDSRSMGEKTMWGQKMAAEIAAKTPEARQNALETFYVNAQEMADKGILTDAKAHQDALRQYEGFDPPAGPTKDVVKRGYAAKEHIYDQLVKIGADPGELGDKSMPQHFPRQGPDDPYNLDDLFTDRRLGKKNDYQRKEWLENIKGGTKSLEFKIIRNKKLVGKKLSEGGDKFETAARSYRYLLKNKRMRELFLGLQENLPKAQRDKALVKKTKQDMRKLAKWLHELPEKTIDTGYYRHPEEAGRNYLVRNAEKLVRSQIILKNVAEQAAPYLAGAAKLADGDKGVSLGSIIKSVNLKYGDFDNGAVQHLAEAFGIQNPGKKLKADLASGAITQKQYDQAWNAFKRKITGLRIPREAANEFTRIRKFFEAPDEVNTIIKAFDSYQNWFKASVLTWPARYVRDFVSSQAQNWFIKAFNAKTVTQVDQFLKGKNMPLQDLKKLPPVMELLAKYGLAETEENANKMLRVHLSMMELVSEKVADVAQIGSPRALQGMGNAYSGMPGVRPLGLKTAAKEVTDRGAWKGFIKQFRPLKPSTYGIRGVGDAAEMTNPYFKAGNTTGVYIDALGRVPGYLELLKKGYKPSEAKAKIMAAHVDYSNRALSPTERKVMTRVFPFYRFSRHTAEFVAKELLSNPHGRMAQVIRGGQRTQMQSDEGQIVPEHISRTLAIPVPKNKLTDALGLSAPEGNTRYLTGFGLMHEDPLSVFQPGTTAYHTARGTMQGLLGRMSPALKMPVEIGMGKQAFSGRELEDLDPNVGRIAANIMGKDTAYQTPILMEQAIANSPAARAVSSLRTATDRRDNAKSKAALNLLTGVRLSDMENEKARNLARRKLLEEYLRKNPNIHRFEHLFAPDDAKLSDKEKALMNLYRQFSRQASKAARERKKQEAK